MYKFLNPEWYSFVLNRRKCALCFIIWSKREAEVIFFYFFLFSNSYSHSIKNRRFPFGKVCFKRRHEEHCWFVFDLKKNSSQKFMSFGKF